MEHSYRRSQARSLAFSIIGHSALVALCVYLSRHLGEHLPAPEKPRSAPAQVQWLPARPTSGGDVLPAGAPDGDSIYDGDAVQQAEVAPKDMTQPLEASEVVDAAPIGRKIAVEDSSLTVTAEPNQTEYVPATHPTTMAASAPDGYHATNYQRPAARPRRSKISGADFMGAFHRSRYTERAEAQQSSAGNYSANGSAGSGDRAIIQTRLNDWKRADFLEKFMTAIMKATKLVRPRIIHFPSAISTDFQATIVIDKKGILKDSSKIRKTGVAGLDQILEEWLFRNTNFPRIPERFGIDEFSFEISAYINFPEGYVEVGGGSNNSMGYTAGGVSSIKVS